jgi:hypothetical protein
MPETIASVQQGLCGLSMVLGSLKDLLDEPISTTLATWF